LKGGVFLLLLLLLLHLLTFIGRKDLDRIIIRVGEERLVGEQALHQTFLATITGAYHPQT